MKNVTKRRQRNKESYYIIINNEITEAQLIPDIVSLKQAHLTSSGVVAGVLLFCGFAAMSEIV